MARRYSIVPLILLLAAWPAAAQPPAAQPAPAQTPTQTPTPAPAASFSVFMQGSPLGGEQVTVSSSADGWVIRATGRLGNPVNMSTSRFEARYDREWRPVGLDIDSSLRGQPMLLHTAFAGGSATSEVTQSGQVSQKVDKVTADAILLPNLFFAAYEALALRLQNATLPVEFRAYVVPQVEIALQVTGVNEERIRTSERTILAKRYTLVFGNLSGPVPAEIWVDEDSRLLRFRVPVQSLEVARDDVAAVSSRVERLGRASDEQVVIPSNGFILAGTLSKPSASAAAPAPTAKGAAARPPAVILVPGSGPVDRDEAVAGIPIFAQMANALADAGFIVVRYDKRGVGQSGGRDESATIQDFADDVRMVVNYLRKRKDVDPDRIAVVGHSEGGLVGMLAASQMKKQIAALALIATPGTTGGDLVLEQQRHLLDRMSIPDEEKRNRMALQQRIQDAVMSGRGWESIPSAYRRQADTPWFRSFLVFDPAQIMPKVSQPVAVVQGDRDRQVSARNADRLIEMARGRKSAAGSALYMIEGVNHLLVPAPTGEVEEYGMLADKKVSVKVLDALTSWLKESLHVDSARARQ